MEFIKFSAFTILFFTLYTTTIPSASAIEEALRSKAIGSLNTALGAARDSISPANGLVRNRGLSPAQTQSLHTCVDNLDVAVTDITNIINGVKNMKDPNVEKKVFVNLMGFSASLEQKCIDAVTAANMAPVYRSKITAVVNKAIDLAKVATTDISNIK